MKTLVLLSGAMGAGKSSVAKELENRFEFRRISSSTYLRTYGESIFPGEERHQLQELGDRLDCETDFLWIVRDVAAPLIEAFPNVRTWLLDAVRKKGQVKCFREQYPSQIQHIHLLAPEEILRMRYDQRAASEDTEYAKAATHPNEIAARALSDIADEILALQQNLWVNSGSGRAPRVWYKAISAAW